MIVPATVIRKKRDGEELSSEEIHGFIRAVVSGEAADYQASAFLMATYFNGMTPTETAALTEAMIASGERFDFSGMEGVFVDKHSTGGVGDKVSLILAPLAAACGLKVPMMSGRGLGHTGGTLDKLESIEGYQINLPRKDYERLLKTTGCSMIGQSASITPADRKLYALRDVTATVECIPLICASILSKKVAEGAQALVLDVKVGSGAFMKTAREARELARWLVRVSKKMKLPARALLTDMSQPLGYAVGNSLEVIECVEIMNPDWSWRDRGEPNGTRSTDLRELTIQLCAHMLEIGKKVKNLDEGRRLARERLEDGSAWKRFIEMVEGHGGNLEQVLDPSTLPLSKRRVTWKAKKRGYLTKIETGEIGQLLVEMGGGRRKASDIVDPGVGFVFHRKLGSKVAAGDPLVTVYAPEKSDLSELEARFHAALQITAARKPAPKLIIDATIR